MKESPTHTDTKITKQAHSPIGVIRRLFERWSGAANKDSQKEAEADFQAFVVEFNKDDKNPETTLMLIEKALLADRKEIRVYCSYAVTLFKRLGVSDGPLYNRLQEIIKELGFNFEN